jgi:hypothetical protein
MASQNGASLHAVQQSFNANPGIPRHRIRTSLDSGEIDLHGSLMTTPQFDARRAE